ncbi:MAG: hypothetical protein AAGC53_02580 [Actinomycetota bacterium]
MHATKTTTDERLSELVAHLSGAPMEQSRAMVRDSSMERRGDDELFRVADALVRLGCGVPAPRRNASMRSLAEG